MNVTKKTIQSLLTENREKNMVFRARIKDIKEQNAADKTTD